MSGRPVIVVGVAGHPQVVADALQAAGRVVSGFVERALGPGATIAGLPVLGDDDWLRNDGGYDLANGIGGVGDGSDRGRRRQVQERLKTAGFSFAVVLAPGTGQGPLVGVPARRRERT